MKLAIPLSFLTLTGFVFGCSDTQNPVTPPAQAAQPTQFNCVEEGGHTKSEK